MLRVFVCALAILLLFPQDSDARRASRAKKPVVSAIHARKQKADAYQIFNLSPVNPKCIMDASDRFDVPVSMILTILDVEGGEVGESSRNTNKTHDLGPMQINTCHLGRLKQYGITKTDLIANGCLNIQVGAFLLKEHLIASGGKRLEAMGRYHSQNEPYKTRYKNRARNAYRELKSNPGKHIDRVLAKANRRTRPSLSASR